MKKFKTSIFEKEVERLKKVLEKILVPGKEKNNPQLVLQPVKTKNI
ncbi:MAG: hypothetical protein IPN82_16635 [Chitinophagaceae bacterium]|nr:hypothetical protein [Chitinophagaceae bacterium]